MVRYLQPGVSVGKILIQRDETKPDKPAVLYYKKLPKNIRDMFVILVDPMLATGGSAIRALSVLKVSVMCHKSQAIVLNMTMLRITVSRQRTFCSSTLFVVPRDCEPCINIILRSASSPELSTLTSMRTNILSLDSEITETDIMELLIDILQPIKVYTSIPPTWELCLSQ